MVWLGLRINGLRCRARAGFSFQELGYVCTVPDLGLRAWGQGLKLCISTRRMPMPGSFQEDIHELIF